MDVEESEVDLTKVTDGPDLKDNMRRKLRTWAKRLLNKPQTAPSVVDHDLRIEFAGFDLTVDASDIGGRAYRDDIDLPAALICPTHRSVVHVLKPKTYVDIGANYGFTTLVHHHLNPTARCIAVEPNPKLQKYLHQNLAPVLAGGCDVKVLNCLCGARSTDTAKFSLNPVDSQDSRVSGMPGWNDITVNSVTLSELLAGCNESDFVYIKIDTQGFEPSVIEGGTGFLKSHARWLIKTEFAPFWLASQGFTAQSYLQTLLDVGTVFEWPKASCYRGADISSLVKDQLTPDMINDFVNHVVSRRKAGYGWCDLGIIASPAVAEYGLGIS